MNNCGKVLLKTKTLWILLVLVVSVWSVMGTNQVRAAKNPDTENTDNTDNSGKKNGWVKTSKATYYYVKGKKATGWKKIGGKKYFFVKKGKKKGQMVTGWMIVNRFCYFFEEDGTYNYKKSANTKRKSDKYGSAAKKTMRRAKAIIATITKPEWSKAKKLKKAFKYTMAYRSTANPRPNYRGIDWPVVYANDMFLDGGGTCYSFAAAFAYLARACGYTKVYACNDSGHGWTEVNGLVYDPEEYRNTSHKYYATPYSRVPGYKRGISSYKTNKYMHVKIK